MGSGTIKGRIITSVGGRYSIRTESSDASALADIPEIIGKIPARGAFRHEKITPLVGDLVIVAESGGSFVVDSILKRKNALIRPAMANLDILYIIQSAASPDPVAGFADKLTVLCEKNRIKPVIVITKCELDRKGAEKTADIYKNCGYDAFILSAATGEKTESFFEYVNAQNVCISAFAGASGVGKSTLLNKLYPSFQCETGEISEKNERGKNTTRRVSLYETSFGKYLADTPGFGLLDFEHFDFCDKEELPYMFPEFEPYLCRCKYTKCSHTVEDGCLIRQAVDDGNISRERYESFLSLHNDIKDKKDWN